MDERIARLAGLIDEAAELLRRHGQTHWPDWLARNAMWIRRLDLYGVETLLSGYGGMGSLNDIYLHSVNGHQIDEKDVVSVNQRLRSLLTEIYLLATELRRAELRAYIEAQKSE
ncbi:MAG: DUF6966 domain-containing protein [Armatimonadota bacterium]